MTFGKLNLENEILKMNRKKNPCKSQIRIPIGHKNVIYFYEFDPYTIRKTMELTSYQFMRINMRMQYH